MVCLGLHRCSRFTTIGTSKDFALIAGKDYCQLTAARYEFGKAARCNF